MLRVINWSEIPEGYTGSVEVRPEHGDPYHLELKNRKKHCLQGAAVVYNEIPRSEHWIEGMEFSVEEFDLFTMGLKSLGYTAVPVLEYNYVREVPAFFTGIAHVGTRQKVAMLNGKLIALVYVL